MFESDNISQKHYQSYKNNLKYYHGGEQKLTAMILICRLLFTTSPFPSTPDKVLNTSDISYHTHPNVLLSIPVSMTPVSGVLETA